ncbi:hypothetical protein [Paenibacillus xylanexedens]|uniref:hypothetical protein n=1 Tax=Paenibacillus xylanexedens TaxID=528191 RepID=UPI000F537982|nr:hypothetical protein [Paenibacillus xylanexedens]RPK31834.1 hypothetical protein EDO6_02461 [Paenibacillus xylanexedens]
MNSFDNLYNNDKQLKQTIINDVITPDNNEAYNNAVDYAVDDLLGTMEAYKHGSITDEIEAQEQIRVFLEEYTVKLLSIVKGE